LPAVNNDCTQNIYSEVLRNNIRKDRIIFLPYIERNLLSERYRQFDLFLDTFPYQAHTTAVEALTSGLPLISISGERLQSRRNNPEKLKQLKERLYFNMNNLNITNPKIYTKNIEMAYTKIFENYQKRQAPKDFYIN